MPTWINRSFLVLQACLIIHIWSLESALAHPTEDDDHHHGGSVISIGHTAHWYDPERSGEGWSLEILQDQGAFVYWFTYDEFGQQRWLVAHGDIVNGHTIEFPELLAASGGQFGSDFDPDQVVLDVVGSASFHFEDCDHGHAEFDVYGEQFEVALRRVNRTMLIDCNPPEDAVEDERGLQTGSWLDPSQAGQGYTLQWMTNGLALITWFSYDSVGNPYWMQGIGESIDGELFFDDVYSTFGPRFGLDFDASELDLVPWGTLTMRLECLDGEAVYDSTIGEFGFGEFTLERLTIPVGLNCPDEEEPPPSALAEARWDVQTPTGGPNISEMPGAALGDDIYLAGGLTGPGSFSIRTWRYRPASGQWTQLANLPDTRDHGMMAAHGGHLYKFGGYFNFTWAGTTNTAWRFDPAANTWTSVARMPGTRSAGAAVALDEHIYVTGGISTSGETIYRYTPASNSWTVIPISDPWPRDHSHAVAYRGEIWILGGRRLTQGGHGGVTIFNPETGESRPGPEMRAPRSGFASGVYKDHIVVAGGELFTPLMVVASAEAYSPKTGWQFLPNLPVPVHGPGSASRDDGFYVMAGSGIVNDVVGIDVIQKLYVPGHEHD